MMNPMLRSQPTRMMGLSSGMDTDFIIQQTLKMHQFKIDNQMRNKKIIEWRQQIHTNIKNEITSLRQTYLSNLGSKTMMNRNVFNATKATVSGTNSSAVTIRTNSGSPLGNFTISKVSQLAKGAHLTTGAGASANGNGFASNARLGELDFANGGAISWTRNGGTVRVGNEDIKVERQNGSDTLTFKNSKGEDIDAAWEGNKVTLTNSSGVSRTLNWDAENNNFTEDRPNIFSGTFDIPSKDAGGDPRKLTITSNLVNGDWQFSTNISGVTATLDEDGKLSIKEGGNEIANLGEWSAVAKTVGGVALEQQTNQVMKLEGEADLTFNTGNGDVNIQIRATDTLSEMITRVNTSAAGVNMSYDRLTDKFTLEAKISSNTDPLTTRLDLFSNSNFLNNIRGTDAPTEIVKAGQQAIVTINDKEEFFNTNSFDYRGVGITLHREFDADDKDADMIKVNLARDAQPAINAIKDFINSYNAIIKRIEDLVSERKTGSEVSYKPLTDEEKQGMTEKQIEEWEAIAKKGLLRNDQGLQTLASSLRRELFEQIEGVGISPSQIGITTGSYFDGTGGQIIIDEERLRAALESDPDMVADIFIRIDSTGNSPRGVGLLHKIDGIMRDYVNTSQSNSIKGLEDSLKRANEQIARMQERMYAEEDRLYRQFAAMESAMSKLQQQGSWFSAMLGGA